MESERNKRYSDNDDDVDNDFSDDDRSLSSSQFSHNSSNLSLASRPSQASLRGSQSSLSLSSPSANSSTKKRLLTKKQTKRLILSATDDYDNSRGSSRQSIKDETKDNDNNNNKGPLDFSGLFIQQQQQTTNPLLTTHTSTTTTTHQRRKPITPKRKKSPRDDEEIEDEEDNNNIPDHVKKKEEEEEEDEEEDEEETRPKSRPSNNNRKKKNQHNQPSIPSTPSLLSAANNNNSTNQLAKDMQIVNKLFLQEKEELRNKRPETTGKLFSYLKQSRKSPLPSSMLHRTKTTIARCLSGGVIPAATLQEYHDVILRYVADDIDNNTVSTIVEAPPVIGAGIRLCVRLRYASFVRLVTQKEFDEHIMIAQHLIRECYPTCNHDCYIAASCPRTKMNNFDPGHQKIVLCNAIQMVWPNIIERDMNPLIAFWSTLELRIRAQNGFFERVVDRNVLQLAKNVISMRTLYACKIRTCEECLHPAVLHRRRKKLLLLQQQQINTGGDDLAYASSEDDLDENDNPDFLTSRTASAVRGNGEEEEEVKMFVPCVKKCFHGKQIKPVIFKPYASVLDDHVEGDIATTTTTTMIVLNKIFFKATMSIYEQLKAMSIIPRSDQLCQFTESLVSNFVLPHDAPVMQDRQQQFSMDALATFYNAEAKEQKMRQRSKNSQTLNRQTFPDVYQLCTKIIRFVDAPTYEHLVAQKVTIYKKLVYVEVDGKHKRHCLLNHGEHPESRIYFVIRPHAYQVAAYCYVDECKHILTLRDKIAKYLEQKKKRRKNGVVLTLPDEQLSEQHENILQRMQADIPFASGLREQLFEAMGLTYTGKRLATATLASAQQEKHTIDQRGREYEPQVWDRATMMSLPRSMLALTLQEKVDYLNSKKMVEPKQIPNGPGFVSSVQPTPISSISYLNSKEYSQFEKKTPEERQRDYDTDVRKGRLPAW